MRRVLVVDDDKMNLRRTRLILEKYYDILMVNPDRKPWISFMTTKKST